MIGREFYEDVASIIQRVSSKTDSMKTNRCVLLNKISGEMNELILKAQDVVKMCLADRNSKRLSDGLNKSVLLE